MLVANSLPALNDITAVELPDIVAEAAKVGLVRNVIRRFIPCYMH